MKRLLHFISILIIASATQIHAQGPVAWYMFNSNARDTSGNGLHGTNNGATPTTDRFGNANEAFDFNGSSSTIQVPDNSLLDLTGDFTLSLWEKSDVVGPTYSRVILSKHPYGVVDGYWLAVHNTGQLDFEADPYFDNTSPKTDSNRIVAGQWQHISFTYDKTAQIWKFYVDNVLVRSGSKAFTITDISNALVFGDRPGDPANVHFDGKLDDILIYNRALSANEIDSLYHVGGYATMTDYDGNVYGTVQIGTQTWMAENLKVTHYRDGSVIPNVTVNATWAGLSTGAYCDYNNDLNNSITYGRLYNWFAVSDARNIAPPGWHVATDTEWTTLETYLGGSSIAGGKLKEAGTVHWSSPNTSGDNSSGFTMLPNGYRISGGAFDRIGQYAHVWSLSGASSVNRDIAYNAANVNRATTNPKQNGFSVRLVKDDVVGDITPPSSPTNLAATAGNQRIDLHWNANTESDFMRYRIYRGTSANPTMQVDSTSSAVGKNDTTKTFTGLENGTTYYFRITAIDSTGNVSGYSNEVSAKPYDLAAYYPFTGGSVADSSGNGNNGTNNGATQTMDRFGNAGSAYSFDGTSDTIGVGNASSVQISGDITVAAWIKTNTLPTNSKVVVSKYGPNGGWLISTPSNTNGTIQFEGQDNSTQRFSGESVVRIDDNTWHFVAGQRSGSIWKIFVDGILSNATDVGSAGPLLGTNSLTIGAQSGTPSATWWNGLIDDIRIYNRALSLSEIDSLYANYHAPDTLMAVKGDQQITIKWSSERINDIAKYRIYRDGTLIDSVIKNTTGDTIYTSTGLTNYQNYQFYIRSVDVYGNVSQPSDTVTVFPCEIVTDFDGNTYTTVRIGTQIWTAENLKTTRYRNGATIPEVTDNGTWSGLTTGAYCNYNNDANNAITYGRLYNWYTTRDSRNIAPAGWHVARLDEWTTLLTYLGGQSVAGGKLKETDFAHWTNPNTGATNETGFTALPNGYRNTSGTFLDIGNIGYWWTATDSNATIAKGRFMSYNNSSLSIGDWSKTFGYSVRLIKGEVSPDLVAYYPFTGNADDSSGNAKDGLEENMSYSSDRFGNSGKAAYFSGVAQIAVNSKGFPTGNSPRTISLWFNKSGNTGVPPMLVGWGYRGTGLMSSLTLQLHNTPYYWGYSDDLTSTGVTVTNGQWYHLVLTFESGVGKIFINGVLNSEGALNPNTPDTTLWIGNFQPQPEFGNFNGKLDDILIFNRALSATEIDSLYKLGGWGVPPSVPQSLTAIAGISQVTLNWRKNTESDFLRYRVYRGTSANPTAQVDSTTGGTSDTSKVITGLTNGTIYYFRVASVDVSGLQSSYSNEVSVMPKTDFTPPAVPELLSATPGDNFIALKWRRNSENDFLRYRVFKGNSPNASLQADSTANGILDTAITVSGLTNGTLYYFRIVAVDSAYNFSSYSNELTGTPVSPTAPLITHTPVQSAQSGQLIAVDAQVSGTNPLVVKLFYGKGSDVQATDSIDMGTSNYSASIPASAVTPRGIWYKIRAQNIAGINYYPGNGDRKNISVKINSGDIGQIQNQSAFTSGVPKSNWFTIGIPIYGTINLTEALGAQKFSGSSPTNWAAYKFNYASQNISGASVWDSVSNLIGGQPYLIFHKTELGNNIFSQIKSPNTIGVDSFENIMLKPGWNFIAWPYAFPAYVVRKSDMARANVGSVWQFFGAAKWDSVKQFRPFSAYMIKNRSGSDLLLSSIFGWDMTQSNLPKDNFVWRIRFGVESGDQKDGINYIGVHHDYAIEESKPLQIGESLSLAFEKKSDNGIDNLCEDMRLNDAEGHVWEMKVSNLSQQKTATLNWSGEQLPSGLEFMLVDISNNEFVDLSSLSTYTFRSIPVNTFKIIAGSLDFVKSETEKIKAGLPKEFTLVQNYPNPFNPSTKIKFDVARSGNVRIKVYNILGQEVATLVNGFYETGRDYETVWNSKDALGREVASGVYIYRLESGKISKTKKMMLVK